MSEVARTLANTIGMEFLGLMLATWVFGVNTVQAYNYFCNYKDGIIVKLTVCILIILDVINTVAGSYGIYLQIIQSLGGLPNLNVPLTVQTTTGNFIIFIVQCFLTRTIWHVSGENKLLTSVVAILVVLSCFLIPVMGLAYPIQGYLSEMYSTAENTLSLAMFSVGIALPTLTDMVITAFLIFYLRHNRTSNPISSIWNTIDRLILYFVGRGIFLTISQLVVLILVVCVSFTMAWSLIQFGLAKVYIHTLLILLNRRNDLRHGDTIELDQVVPTLTFINEGASRRDNENVEDSGVEPHTENVDDSDKSYQQSSVTT